MNGPLFDHAEIAARCAATTTAKHTTLGLLRRDVAIEQTRERHAEWCDRVVAWILAMPPGHEFTSDELWQRSAELPAAQRPREPRAMGAAIKVAATRGLAETTERYVKSARPECHARPVLVWRRR